MRLRSLRLTNFRQHADTSIEFGPGITGIIGPNGTGQDDDPRSHRVGALWQRGGARPS